MNKNLMFWTWKGKVLSACNKPAALTWSGPRKILSK